MGKISCFKAYDVRGRVPGELNEDLAYRIGRAYAAFSSPARVAVGRDIRFSSLPLAEALSAGLNDAGVEAGTWALRHGTDLLRHRAPASGRRHHGHRQPQPPGIQRHEVRPGGSRPLSGDSGLDEIERLAVAREFPPAPGPRGTRKTADALTDYIAHLLSYVDALHASRP